MPRSPPPPPPAPGWRGLSADRRRACGRDRAGSLVPLGAPSHMCPAGLWASLRPGWAAESTIWGSPTTPDAFSSSRRFKQAALGFRLRSGGRGRAMWERVP